MKPTTLHTQWSDEQIKGQIRTAEDAQQAWDTDPALRQEFGNERFAWLAYVKVLTGLSLSPAPASHPAPVPVSRETSTEELLDHVRAEQAARDRVAAWEAAGFSNDTLRAMTEEELENAFAHSSALREEFLLSKEGLMAYVRALKAGLIHEDVKA